TYARTNSGGHMDISGEWQSECISSMKHIIRIHDHRLYVDKDIYDDGACTTLNHREKDTRFSRESDGDGGSIGDRGDFLTQGWKAAEGDVNFVPAPNGLAGPPLQDPPLASIFRMPTTSLINGSYWTLFVDDTDASNGNYAFYLAENYAFLPDPFPYVTTSRKYIKQ
ncbi:MAG: hypothetical protein OEY07_14960, partial [Gammaproteobacteria bacterium]|nr:hypothetical protein [Gammaproteobacteria bacterium]